MKDFENYVYEPIELCACYEPMFEAPQELIDEWAAAREAEREEPDGVPTFYVYPINFSHNYPVLRGNEMRKKADDLENALFDIRLLTNELLDHYYTQGKLVRAGYQKLRRDEEELSPEQKKELKQWLIEAAGLGGMELKYCGGDFSLDLPTLDRLLKAAQRYRDAVNAEEDGADVLQEEIDRYVEEYAAADAKYLARKWFENGRIEGFELPVKLAASIQKLIDRAHNAKKERLDAFEQYRLDRLELWRQYKPGFEAWSGEPETRPETKPATELEPEFQSECSEESGSGAREAEEESEPGKESLSGPETQVETSPEEQSDPEQRQEDAPAFSALAGEKKELDVATSDEKDDDGFQPMDFDKIELGRRD